MNFQMLESATSPEAEFVLQGLKQYNEAHIYPYKMRDLVIAVFDDEKKQIGGVVGYTAWDWLYVRLLWVIPEFQGGGTGAILMAKAEEEAIRRGVYKVWVDTFNERAKPFYERLGYRVFGQLEDFPPGHCRYFLMKSLKA